MRESLSQLCSAFIVHRDTLKRTFRFESNYIYPVCANIFCARQKSARQEELIACKKLVNEKTSVFSNFRGSLKLPVISMLAAGGHPEAMLDRTLDNYALLKQQFHGSQYLALSAILLEDMGVRSNLTERIIRGKDLYRRMKKEHRLLTSAEDSVFALLLAFSELPDEALVEDMEACYRLVKSKFGHSNAAQSVSHVLAMTAGTPQEKTDKMFAIYDGLRAEGRKYGKYYELPTLAAVSVLDVEVGQVVQDMLEADAFLAQQKGYGVFSMDKKTRLMHAAMLSADDYCMQKDSSSVYQKSVSEQSAANGAVMTSTLAMLAAQQAAMCAVMMSSSAAASASASNS